MSLTTETRKEHHEHPWTTMAQARRIAKDHLMKSNPARKEFSRYGSVSVKRHHNGSLEVSAVIDGYRESEVYYGYTVREAVAEFREKFRKPRSNPPVLHWYSVTVNHDKGFSTIRTKAVTMEQAARQVCAAEGCPRSAIASVWRMAPERKKVIRRNPHKGWRHPYMVATKVSQAGGVEEVKLYSTVVFAIDRASRKVTLNSGGYRTVTTKSRINDACRFYGVPFSVYQKAGSWYVLEEATGVLHDFRDGMTVSY